MKVSNQKGSIDLLAALLCFSLISLLAWYCLRRIEQWEKMKRNLTQLICIKKFHKETKDMIRDIHNLNKVLVADNILQVASTIFPGAIIAKVSLKKVKQAIKLLQRIKLAGYIKSTSSKLYNRCPVDPRAFKTPFKLNIAGLGFTRSSLGLTKLRQKQWTLCHPLKFQIICSKFNNSSSLDAVLEIKTKAYFLPRLL